MLHLYALVPHPGRLAAVTGIDDSQVRAVTVAGSIDALVSGVSTGRTEASETAILAHATAVEELAAVNEALLPARFGHRFAREEALVDAIAGREADVHGALERVRGCVELGLRVVDESASANGSDRASGREYMLGRLEEVKRAERIAAEIQEALAANARENASSVLASPQLLLSAAYLLPRSELRSFQAALYETELRHPELTFVCTGPWPPYSFALLESGAP